MNPIEIDEVLICPYDKNHKIARSRIQRHLVKCEKNFPPNYKVLCPYDATHRVFETELIKHLTTCPRRNICSNVHADSRYTRLPDIDITKESLNSTMNKTDMWDKEDDNDEDLHSNTIHSFDDFPQMGARRGHPSMAGPHNRRLRQPFGFSETEMLDIDNSIKDEEVESVTSLQGIGRGSSVTEAVNQMKHYTRGGRGFARRGYRSRLLP